MTRVTIHEAKTNLSDLIRRAEAGEEIVIARGDKPVAVRSAIDNDDIARRRASAFECLSGTFASPTDEALFTPVTLDDMGFESYAHDPAADRPAGKTARAKSSAKAKRRRTPPQ